MLFNSYIFTLLFLPLCLIGYFSLNALGLKKPALAFLLCMSLWFYGTNMPVYLLLITGSILVNFGFYALSKRLEAPKKRKLAKLAAVAVNLGVLFYFKYYDFFISTVNSIFASDWELRHVLLPLGISFFTFQQISFVVDAFNGEVPDYGFLDYACFVTFFPQLIAGPIVTHDELVPQLRDESRKHFSWESFMRGIFIFSIGLAKKVLIADTLSRAVNTGYSLASDGNWDVMNSSACIVVMLSYTLQMYFDFSGYSDMAIGIGKMFNIDLPQNFNSPYKALTITDHWKRWHITLTRFLTKYIYIPLGGSHRGKYRTYINIMLVYFLSGLWHGAGWNYILWGVLHGAFCVMTRAFDRFFKAVPKLVNWFITFLFINLGFIIFRSDSVSGAFTFIAHIFSFDFGVIEPVLSSCFDISEVRILLSALPLVKSLVSSPAVFMLLFLALCMFIVLVPRNAFEQMRTLRPRLMTLLLPAFLLVWCIFSFGGVSEFLYFNF